MRKNITVEFTNERIIPSVGLAVVGAILDKNDFVKRRRHRTVINNLINMACHITEHARKLVIGLGKSNVWRDAIFTGNGGTLCRKPRCHFHLSRIIISKYDLRLGSRIQDNIKIV